MESTGLDTHPAIFKTELESQIGNSSLQEAFDLNSIEICDIVSAVSRIHRSRKHEVETGQLRSLSPLVTHWQNCASCFPDPKFY